MTTIVQGGPDIEMIDWADILAAEKVARTEEEENVIRIVAVSDLHGFLPPTPECDILILAGDLSPVYMTHKPDRQRDWWDDALAPWLKSRPASYKLVIGGNHDFCAEQYEPYLKKVWSRDCTDNGYGRTVYLRDESFEAYGIKMYAYPWVPNLQTWAFYGNDHKLRGHAELIPSDTELLITHGGPLGLGDNMIDGRAWTHVGDEALRSRVTELNALKLHVFGHIHESYGLHGLPGRDTLFHNVAYLDRDYETTHPLVLYTKERGVYTQVEEF